MAEKIYPVTVPKWGIEMQEGTITDWHAETGATVEKGQELIDIETDKIVNTMEAPVSGILRRQLVGSGETLKVGELLGIIASQDADEAAIDEFVSNFVPADASFAVDEDFGAGTETDDAPPAGVAAASNSSSEPGAERRISPVARRLAAKLGVDIQTVKGSGRNGRVSTDDVEAAAAARKQSSGDAADTANRPAHSASGSLENSEATPVSGTPLAGRALTQARRMVESKQNIPHFYLTRELDMTAALAKQQASSLPLTAVIVHALVRALQAQPAVNMHFRDNKLIKPDTLGINIAIDTSDGLVAPLLNRLESVDAAEIASRLKELAKRARDRQLGSDDQKAGGITLSNLGMFGISSFSAIINPPQVAILAVGSVRPIQLALDAAPVAAMSATLSCDHRALDGAAGARFLDALQAALLDF